MAKKKQKRRKYTNILEVPLEKLTGWMEVSMDIDKLRNALEAARLQRQKREVPKKKRKYSHILRGGQTVPMDIDKINASFALTQKE